MGDEKKKKIVGRFRVLRGSHSEGYNPDGSIRIYHKGDIVDSVTNLLKHNKQGSIKFQKVGRTAVDEEETVTDPEDVGGYGSLADMTVDELKEVAAAEEIDLEGATRRKEIVSRIEAALVTAS